ncbi:flagellar biosynthesis protein FliQ [Telmatospirillum sp. J64-1]|uniref:flagellar biosynthesis protein FliQ n=1 Tax=Telmatospirillum sp. J64-1 TaxID=2502183 RepID=UPI00115CA593|nr:flagellar biosynthesis protein FliQ [Telmatospirillum sp. J64-1]
MTEAEVLDVARLAIFTMLKVSVPVLLTGLVVGLIIALFQALTHIQEMTLTFVPKIILIFVSLMLFLPFMLHTMVEFTMQMMDRAIAGG